jgi:UDP-glucose 4-epimerase
MNERANVQTFQRSNVSTFLVTGGAGFIGSNIVERLVAQRTVVRVLDNFSTGKRANIEPWLDRLELVEGDVRHLETVRRAVKGVDYVLHQAAIPSVPRSVDDPLESHACNATATLNVLLAARDAGVRRVVYASSCAAYGDSPELPKREDMATDPLSPYAVSKLAGEHYCRAASEVYGLETVALRYFNVFGPRQDPASEYAAVIPAFVTLALDGERPVVYGDGLQSRDFVYVANVVDANLLACRAEGVAGQVFNVACGERITLLALLEALERIMGREVRPRFEPERPGDVRHSVATIEKARTGLGYEPGVGFEEGLRRTVAFFAAR